VIGLYLSEILSIALFLLPKAFITRIIRRLAVDGDAASNEISLFAARQLTHHDILLLIRTDGISTYGMIALSIIIYGPFWHVVPLVLLVRGVFISFANNLPHYGTSPGDVKYGLNIRLPRMLEVLYLNFNHHRIHHHDPLLPWTALPSAFRSSGETFDVPLSDAALAQFHGPIPRTRFAATPSFDRSV
jgi:fatty acid desaturase